MRRARLLAVLAMTAFASPGLAQDTCPEGRPATGDLGIERYRCVGGACQIWTRADGEYAHVFTTEPRIDQVDPDGPASDRLRVGDVIVAVDDLLITTAAAGRRLANLDPGVPVRLWLRREGRDLQMSVTPIAGCGPHGLTVRIPGAR